MKNLEIWGHQQLSLDPDSRYSENLITKQNFILGEICAIQFSNFNRIWILFWFERLCKYKNEYIMVWKFIQIEIWIIFGLKISGEYEYHLFSSVTTIQIYPNTESFWIKLDAEKPQNIHIAYLYSCQNKIWGQLVTKNVYILIFGGNLTILVKNTFLGWDSCQSLACGWYSPLTQVMMGVLWAT